MIALLLDTTVLIDVLRGKAARRRLLADMVVAGHILATAAINIAEVYAGMRPSEAAATDSLLSNLDCYPLTQSIARSAGLLKTESARKGRTVSLADTIVAATALEHDLLLLTDNRKDFVFPGLKLFS